MRIVERDRVIVEQVARWRYCLGRQIKILCDFEGQRATDRRLQKLISEQFLERRHILYGLPGLYFVTDKATEFFNMDLSKSKVRLDQIYHDIAVIDTVIYFIKNMAVDILKIESEKELRHKMGFNPRTHVPDFVYTQDLKKYCVEIETSMKAKVRFEKNIKDNYLKYETQYWIVPDNKVAIKQFLSQAKLKYNNIEILSLEVIQEYAQKFKDK
ncbi:MAG: hypothetical protein N2749_04800 [Clostridia bacterium]|nr:hypothetical protein [Clostridia bacterium]